MNVPSLPEGEFGRDCLDEGVVRPDWLADKGKLVGYFGFVY